jgi:hypothetical protein
MKPRWYCWWTRWVRGERVTTKVHAFPHSPVESKVLVALCGVRAPHDAGLVEFWGPESSANEKCQRCLKIWRKKREHG